MMQDQVALLQHLLTQPIQSRGCTVFSGFTAVLRDARGATGRNPDTGAKIEPARLCSWLGAVGYLILLDQIGTCFRPRGTCTATGNSINKALSYFTDLKESERNVIYALRCTFAHDYSLVNIKKGGRPHHFKILSNLNSPVVVLPSTPWDGNYSTLTENNATIINVQALGDQVEEICRKLVNLATIDRLDVILPGGVDELRARYGISFTKGE